MSKPDLILLHGALGAKTQFDRFIPFLEDDFQLHIFNFEGHGDRDYGGRPFRMDGFMENVIEYMDGAGLEKTDIFGYSMGGYVALVMAMKKPERVKRVFTLATKFNWDPDYAEKEARTLDVREMETKLPDFVKMLGERHSAIGWQTNMKATAEMMLHLGENPELLLYTVPDITVPVRLTLGDSDNMVTIEETAAIYRNIRFAEMEVFPSTQHPLERVNAEMLSGRIKNFFL